MTDADTQTQEGGPPDRPFLASMADQWWLFLIRGIAAILFGVLALIWPGLTIIVLTLFWGAYSLIDGVLSIYAGIAGRPEQRGPRWWLIVVGILGIAAGLIALILPGFAAAILLLLIAVWAVAIGILQVIGAIRLRKEIENEWLLGLSGALLVVFGVLFLLQPAAGALTVVWLIALFAFLFGANLIALAFKLRGARREA